MILTKNDILKRLEKLNFESAIVNLLRLGYDYTFTIEDLVKIYNVEINEESEYDRKTKKNTTQGFVTDCC